MDFRLRNTANWQLIVSHLVTMSAALILCNSVSIMSEKIGENRLIKMHLRIAAVNAKVSANYRFFACLSWLAISGHVNKGEVAYR